MDEDPGVEPDRLSVAILQTCKRINEEGTPILYGQNNFTICLRKCLFLALVHSTTRQKLLRIQIEIRASSEVT